MSADHDGYGDPAIEALTQLLESERSLARAEEPALVARCDPGQVWLLWFAIGATDEICRFAHRRADYERNQVFRHVVGMIFGNGVQSDASPVVAAQDLIELFESAGNRGRAGMHAWRPQARLLPRSAESQFPAFRLIGRDGHLGAVVRKWCFRACSGYTECGRRRAPDGRKQKCTKHSQRGIGTRMPWVRPEGRLRS